MPAMTPQQLADLKADILANTNVVPAGQLWTNGFAGTQIRNLPPTSAASDTIAGWYNLTAAPDFTVWRDLPTDVVRSLITFANMTPLDPVPTDTSLNAEVWIARSLACQGKQFNLQNLIQGTAVCPMKRANFRGAMQDCLTGLPAGSGGATLAANWVGVRDAAKFLATNFEKLFSQGTGSTNSPADLVLEGAVTADQVQTARELP